MPEPIRQFVEEHGTLIWWLSAGSLAMLLGSLFALPIVAVNLPGDFIVRKLDPRRCPPAPDAWVNRHPVYYWTGRVLKNAAGLVLAIAGLAMLVLPGQGLLCLAMALLLLDLPGKQKLEARLLRSRRLLRLINHLRTRYGREPLQQ